MISKHFNLLQAEVVERPLCIELLEESGVAVPGCTAATCAQRRQSKGCLVSAEWGRVAVLTGHPEQPAHAAGRGGAVNLLPIRQTPQIPAAATMAMTTIVSMRHLLRYANSFPTWKTSKHTT